MVAVIIGLGIFKYDSVASKAHSFRNVNEKSLYNVSDSQVDEWPFVGDENDKTFKDYSLLVNEINDYMKDKKGHYGIYFISLVDGQEFGINEEEEFVAASTIKVPINLFLFNKFLQGEDPSKKIVYTQRDYEEGTGYIQNRSFGEEFSLKTLSKASIENSDNVATNMLIRYLKRPNICDFEETIVGHKVYRDKNISTPKDIALYMKAIYEFSNKYAEEGKELIEYLSNTEFNDRMPLYMPKNVTIAHKIGSIDCSFHDVGIVYGDNPFVLCVMSKENNEKEACEVIGKITKMAYDFENSLVD